MPETYDRAAQDVGNIISLEHVNTRVDDQTRAHLFYVTGMGFTRDPYIDFGLRNILSVLRTAGGAKRIDPNPDKEEAIFLRTARDKYLLEY